MEQRDYWTLFWRTGMPEAWVMSRDCAAAREISGGVATGLFPGGGVPLPVAMNQAEDRRDESPKPL